MESSFVTSLCHTLDRFSVILKSVQRVLWRIILLMLCLVAIALLLLFVYTVVTDLTAPPII